MPLPSGQLSRPALSLASVTVPVTSQAVSSIGSSTTWSPSTRASTDAVQVAPAVAGTAAVQAPEAAAAAGCGAGARAHLDAVGVPLPELLEESLCHVKVSQVVLRRGGLAQHPVTGRKQVRQVLRAPAAPQSGACRRPCPPHQLPDELSGSPMRA